MNKINKTLLMLSAAPIAFSPFATSAAVAGTRAATAAQGTAPKLATPPTPKTPATRAPAAKSNGEAVFSTGVAKGRDRLDSATSTSALKASEIEEYGARSLGEILRNIPGVRVEYEGGEGNANYSIRGLPLAATGSKYMQLQEDGLPVLEFGDIYRFTPDMFMRADLNVAQVEAIRGGSASTFASNSPGGVINLLSKTGDVEGGAIQGTLGLNYGEHRIDADYGHKLSDTLRFHVGGFYRQGEGPRNIGYDAYKGGQIKFNVTKQLSNGFVRVYGKYLNDRTPPYYNIPILVTGTNAHPVFSSLPSFDLKTDTYLSRNITDVFALDGKNKLAPQDARDGQHAVAKSAGLEAQFDVAGFSISEKFRFSAHSGDEINIFPITLLPPTTTATIVGGPGARLSYATGPQAGQPITSPATLNGNGLLVQTVFFYQKLNSLDDTTNDLRASRVLKIGQGDLTATAGFYKSRQTYNAEWSFLNTLSDVRGGGNAALVNVTTAAGVAATQSGYIGFGRQNGTYRRSYDVNYDVNAPYGSVNYHIGKLAIGGSVRYDLGKVKGVLYGAELGGGRNGIMPYDINGDGIISLAESQTTVLPLGSPGLVDYHYHYLSYSAGVNFRVAEPLAVFARYSRGGRAAAERILFTGAVNYNTGKPLNPATAFDTVKQTELGLKFRKAGVTVNVTAFSATTGERNTQIISLANGNVGPVEIVRTYSARGAEVEMGVHRGPFSLSAGATYTKAKIASDQTNPQYVGNIPRHQANLIYEATPQIETKYVTIGANIIGTTSNFAQDINQLKIPGYALVNGFLQVRPVARVQLMLNANNLFNKLAIAEVTQGSVPANGIVNGRPYTGRTVSGTVRYSF